MSRSEAREEKAKRLAALLKRHGFTAQQVARFSDHDWQELCRADKAAHAAARSWRSEEASSATRLMVLGYLVKA